MPRREMHVVIGGRVPKIPLGVFTTRALADAYCAHHNAWYGAEHPLGPLEVRPLEVDPEPMPLAKPDADGNLSQLLGLAAIGPAERSVETPPRPQYMGQQLRASRR